MKGVFTGAVLSIALLSLRSPAQDQQHTGLTGGGTVIYRGERAFVAGKNFNIWFTRDFQELLSIAETSDIDSLPRVSADQINRIDFKEYSSAESAAIKKADRKNVINCDPQGCRFRKGTIERLNGKKEQVYLECTEAVHGAEGETYALRSKDTQAVISH
jgi:hypothetical protein